MADQSNRFHAFEGLKISSPGLPDEVFHVRPPGGTVRFAWGRRGYRSAVWNVSPKPKKADIYISDGITMQKDIKISLHARVWVSAWIQNEGKLTASGQAFFDIYGHRRLDEVRRPNDGGSIVVGQQIMVLHDDVQRVPNDTGDLETVQWLDPPERGQAGVVEVLIWKGQEDGFEGPMVGVVGTFGLVTEEVCVVAAFLYHLDESELQVANSLRSEMSRVVSDKQRSFAAKHGETLRGVWHSVDSRSVRNAWDVALAPPS